MASDRTFRDASGIEWRVTTADGGWLSFESGWMERRLTPVPWNWETATIGRLEQMCRVATPVERDYSPIGRPPRPSSDEAGAVPAADAPEKIDETIQAIPSSDHVSRLVNSWPVGEGRITFRG
jgi:hypothetical protein